MKKLILILVTLSVSGCTATKYQIAFPGDNNPSTFKKYDVPELQGMFPSMGGATFKPYAVRVARSSIIKNSINADGSNRSDTYKSSTENYSYQLSESGEIIWNGQCTAYSEKKILEDADNGRCKAISSSGAGEPVEISIESQEDKDVWYRGYVKRGRLKLDIESTKKVAGKKPLVPMNIGFYIFQNGRLVAVVQCISGGAVYISDSLKPELLPLVLNASAFLLTYLPPDA